MTFWKAASVIGAWLAFTATICFGVMTANAQDPAEAPAAAAAPAEETQPAEAPAAVEAAPAAEAPAAAETAAPAETATPAETAQQAGAASLTAKDLPIGAAVFGADGAKIGEVNRVTAESSGIVTAIHVTTGGKAGLNAEAVVVPADKIAGAGERVKLSLSASEFKNLPPASADAG